MGDESLAEIGLKHGTDKGTNHSYLDYYESVLRLWRAAPIALLELGVQTGASLEMWAEYFPNAEIHGVDIDLGPVSLRAAENPRIRLYQGDVTHIEQIRRYSQGRISPDQPPIFYDPAAAPVATCFCEEQFDVIIDDASHVLEYQILTLHYFWRYLKPGGFYFVEDIQGAQRCPCWTLPGFKVNRFEKYPHDILVMGQKQRGQGLTA